MEAIITMPIDMTDVDSFRRKISSENKIHVSINSLIIKAAANALEDFPIISGAWLSADKIWVSDPVEITIWGAVQIVDGLGIYIVEKARQKKLIEIAEELNVQIDEIKTKNKYTPEGWKPKIPSLSITNVGTIGPVELGSIVRASQFSIVTAILAAGAILEKPAVKDEQVVVRKMMNVALLFDHRAMMANTPIEFLNELKMNLEEPDTYLA